MPLFDILYALIVVSLLVKVVFYCFILCWSKKKSTGRSVICNAANTNISIDFIVPAYNEESCILKTVASLLKVAYDNFSIVVVDDGSLDATYNIVKQYAEGEKRVSVFTKRNEGKSRALNYGIRCSKADIVICIDADTIVKKNLVIEFLPHFKEERVAAVSGHLKVGNVINKLTRHQYVEYVTIMDFERKVFDKINCIPVVPGAIGAFRRKALIEAGGFSSDTMAEDCDLTFRLLRNGHAIRNASTAIAMTEAPDSAKMFFRQRYRWVRGMMQNLVKHGNHTSQNDWAGYQWLLVPYLWCYKIILPVIMPLFDYLFLYSMLSNFSLVHLGMYLALCVFDAATTSYILLTEKEGRFITGSMLLSKIVYRHYNLLIYIEVFINLVRQSPDTWKKITRTGRVQEL